MKRTVTSVTLAIGLAFASLMTSSATASAKPAPVAAVHSQNMRVAPHTTQSFRIPEVVEGLAPRLARISFGELKHPWLNLVHRPRVAARVAAQVAPTVAVPFAATVTYHGGGIWSCIAYYESGDRWSINDGNGFIGGLQFDPGTWRDFGGLAYAPIPSAGQPFTATPAQQIAIAIKVQASQGWGAWPKTSVKCGV